MAKKAFTTQMFIKGIKLRQLGYFFFIGVKVVRDICPGHMSRDVPIFYFASNLYSSYFFPKPLIRYQMAS